MLLCSIVVGTELVKRLEASGERTRMAASPSFVTRTMARLSTTRTRTPVPTNIATDQVARVPLIDRTEGDAFRTSGPKPLIVYTIKSDADGFFASHRVPKGLKRFHTSNG